jgi:type I restriction enzyme M protein
MLNAETKRHIDAARDVLVGVAPNPMSQIDQITYALIYKFMDDMDQSAVKAGGEPSFFTGELEPYAWSKLVDSRMGNQEKMNLYGEALQKFAEAKQLPELFRTIFRAALLPYRSPETLGLFLKEINFFDYTHPEDLGNAYEYLLSIMSAQGDAGQFRTPRHIIDFIVQVINPTKDDTVLDPACGTGGFLVSSYKHILEKHDGRNDPSKQEQPLTPDERKKLMNNFEGYDIDPSMVRIAQVNMYLHQFKNPKIVQYDSLTNEERWNDKFDVILANPPFMSPKGGIKPHNKFAIQASRSEVLFVDYIANHLKPSGRAGIIVPEGIVFQGGKAYKQLRKELVEGGLYAVISLPSGVFQPYSGVKTSILLINKSQSANSDRVLFLELRNLGISLGAAKNLISENDLPKTQQILAEFQDGKQEFEDKFAFSVSKKDIEDRDFNLSAPIYRQSVNLDSVHTFERLIDVCNISKGKSSSTKTETGPYQLFLTAENSKSAAHFDFSGEGVAVPLISATGHGKADVKRVHYVEGKFALANLLAFVEPKDKSSLSPKYLFHILSGNKTALAALMKGAANVSMNISDLGKFTIPVPPIEVQEEIVAELDGYASIIDGARKIVESWKPRIDVDPDWPLIAISDLADIKGGATPSRKEPSYWGGDVEWLTASNIANDGSIQGFEGITQEGLKSCSSSQMPRGATILITRVSVGKVGFCTKDGYAFNQDLTGLIPNEAKIHPKFLYYSAWTLAAKIEKAATGTGVRGVTREYVAGLQVPTPPLAIQVGIVEQLEKQEQAVKAAFGLVGDFENRVSKAISTLWSE